MVDIHLDTPRIEGTAGFAVKAMSSRVCPDIAKATPGSSARAKTSAVCTPSATTRTTPALDPSTPNAPHRPALNFATPQGVGG